MAGTGCRKSYWQWGDSLNLIGNNETTLGANFWACSKAKHNYTLKHNWLREGQNQGSSKVRAEGSNTTRH